MDFPHPLSTQSSLHFALLRAWLQQCDTSHSYCQRGEKARETFPTRLLDLSKPDVLRLVSGHGVFPQRYIALSHCWGKLAAGEIPEYCTTTRNIRSREEGREFCVDDLPLTFHDAIKVSHGLGIRYLWIDSLCIIQKNPEDWIKESRRMEDVYAGAYCTIAATSAADPQEGFLKQDIDNRHTFVDDNLGGRVYICPNTANFDQEVEKSRLNMRAWVLQERLLSCRIIHFGSHQTYFECGEGRFGEDLTQMKRYEAQDCL